MIPLEFVALQPYALASSVIGSHPPCAWSQFAVIFHRAESWNHLKDVLIFSYQAFWNIRLCLLEAVGRSASRCRALRQFDVHCSILSRVGKNKEWIPRVTANLKLRVRLRWTGLYNSGLTYVMNVGVTGRSYSSARPLNCLRHKYQKVFARTAIGNKHLSYLSFTLMMIHELLYSF